MYDGKSVAVVVPAYNEEALIASTVSTIPDFVDRIIVVDDGSKDATVEKAKDADPRVDLIVHDRIRAWEPRSSPGTNGRSPRRWTSRQSWLPTARWTPTTSRRSCRASRPTRSTTPRRTGSSPARPGGLIPRTRYLGNAVLSFLTKIASGYWHVADSQSGYTAVNLPTLKLLDLDRIYKRYGFPNDLLVHLNVWNRRVRDYPSRPIYGVGERSGIRLRHVVPKISWLLTKGFFWRMKEKYIIRDFHPLVLFYSLGMLLFGAGFALGWLEVGLRIAGNPITSASIVLVALLVISGLQLLLFAMWFDMESNKDLR